MAVILAAVGPAAALEGEGWAAAHAEGGRVWRPDPDVLIAAGAAGGPLAGPSVATDGARIAVADAALYYRADLGRRLRDAAVAVPEDASAAALLLAAHDAWGDRLAEPLEGDFAFLLWDGGRRRLLAGRDFLGRRALHHALVGDTLVVATRAGAVAAHPRVPRELDLAAIAATAAGLSERGWSTAWSAVSAVPTGRTIVARQERDGRVERVEIERHWRPPTFESGDGPAFRDAAAELRETIVAATAERLDPERPTAVWLSGGWDSPTVYGAGREAIRRRGGGPLRAVTMSYPPGDPGREDELVEEVLAHWGGRVDAWCDAGRLSLFGGVRSDAALADAALADAALADAALADAALADAALADAALRDAAFRDLPLAHPYGEWSRALAAATVATGARVALDGGGGDQLFQVSPVYLADLVARLRFLAARREWRARGMTGAGWRRLVQYAVHPLLPSPLLALARVARGGRPVPGARAWPVPPWIHPEVARTHDLARFAGPAMERRPAERHAAAESRWYFESAYPPAILRAQAEVAAREGLELRSPLLDRRVIELAARRPREERSDRGETKRLLRAAAGGLVPASVLAPRPSRTGVTSGYFERALALELPELARGVMEESTLVALGVVDRAAFLRAVDDVRRVAAGPLGVAMFYTVQVELWLRAHVRP